VLPPVACWLSRLNILESLDPHLLWTWGQRAPIMDIIKISKSFFALPCLFMNHGAYTIERRWQICYLKNLLLLLFPDCTILRQPTVFVLCDSTHFISKPIHYWSAECRKSVASSNNIKRMNSYMQYFNLLYLEFNVLTVSFQYLSAFQSISCTICSAFR